MVMSFFSTGTKMTRQVKQKGEKERWKCNEFDC